jgi:hypothetical protein
VRTAFHDAVARFGGSVVARSGVVFPPSRFAETTSDTPVAIRPLNLPEGTSSRSFRRDQFTPHRVNDGELPRPGVPSPFSRMADCSATCARPIARCSGGDATQHMIRSHSRTLVSSHASEGDGIRLGATFV